VVGHRKRVPKQQIAMIGSLLLVLAVFGFGWQHYRHTIGADETVVGPADEFGIQVSAPSLPTDVEKQLAIDKTAAAGFGWMRQEFYYEESINFANYDTVARMARAKGLKTLGLLSYPGPERSHEQWKAYVTAMVTHYKDDVAAWEIMNEIDNYLSGAEYTVYLKEAHDIIRGINPNATIILSGITSRPESAKFWDGVATSGGWGYFDVVGLHHYHRQQPERINFGGGDLVSELSRPVSTIRKYGSKKIWVTEIGYIDSVGRDNQANWLARTLMIGRSVPEIDKMFIYRLSNKQADFPFGLLDDNMNEFAVYGSVKRAMAQITGKGTGTQIIVEDRSEYDTLDSLNGWSIPDKKNATAHLSLSGGPDGTAMQIDYTFSADQAYVVVGRNIPMGTPQAIAAWFYGDDSNNVWKYRFTDAKGEVWQADLGAIPSGWSYKQFVLGSDTALVSWSGDGKIDYPITFNSVVIDRQNGKDRGTGMVDEITAVTGKADLSVIKYGNRYAYWKTNGSGGFNICGTNLDFSETPKTATNMTCSDSPKTVMSNPGKKVAAPKTKTIKPRPVVSVAPPIPSPTVEPSPTLPSPEPTPVPTPSSVDIAQSEVAVHGQSILADGYSHYQINITLRDEGGQIVTDVRPVVASMQNDVVVNSALASTNLFITRPTMVNNSWRVIASSTTAGQYPLLVSAGDAKIKIANLNFVQPTPEFGLTTLVNTYRSLPYRKLWFIALVVLLIGVAYGVVSLGVNALYATQGPDVPIDLGNYIYQQRKNGFTDAYLLQSLVAAGWPEALVRRALHG
jgi:hypothetical protein